MESKMNLTESLLGALPTGHPVSARYKKKRTIESTWIDAARRNPAHFITYLTDGEKEPAEHHREWLKLIFNFNIRRLIIEAFPSSAKTTIAVHSLAWMIGKFPHLTHMICSVSEEQATQRLAELREIINSQRYKNVFPHIHMDYKRPNNSSALNIWSDRVHTGDTKQDYASYRSFVAKSGEPRDHTVYACGVTSKGITGKRISGFALIDDPHNETNSATSEQRAKVANAIRKEILSRFSNTSPHTKAIIIMTPWAEDDCAGRLLEDTKIDGRAVWKLHKTPIRKEDGTPAWPEIVGEEKIAEIEADKGSVIFDLMYMLNPIAASSRQVTLDMLRLGLPVSLPDFRELLITCDFAKTENLDSDYTVFLVIARDKEKRWVAYVLDGMRFKEEQIQTRVDKLILFADRIRSDYGISIDIVTEENDSRAEVQLLQELRPDLSITPINTKGRNKEDRFKAPAGWLQQKRVFFNVNMPVYQPMCSELISFPKGKHDDTVDALSLAWLYPSWQANSTMRAGIKMVKSRFLV